MSCRTPCIFYLGKARLRFDRLCRSFRELRRKVRILEWRAPFRMVRTDNVNGKQNYRNNSEQVDHPLQPHDKAEYREDQQEKAKCPQHGRDSLPVRSVSGPECELRSTIEPMHVRHPSRHVSQSPGQIASLPPYGLRSEYELA